MKVRFLGACQEVGRSGILVEAGEDKVLLDYGVLLNDEIGFPAHVSPKELRAAILSHAHLDHSGLMPLLYVKERIPLYGVEPTFEFTRLLVKDMLKLSGYYLPYEYLDLETMLESSTSMAYGEDFRIGNFRVALLNAGHIPGSAQVLLGADERRLLYTGDYNTTTTRLLAPADQGFGDVDAVIIEGTYALEDHPDRLKTEEEFVGACVDVVSRGGRVLVPAFGVGRAQEAMCILVAHDFPYPIFVDGMARESISILMNHPHALRDLALFRKAMERSTLIDSWSQRRKALGVPGVLISPAGMLKGGPAAFYIDSIAREEMNAIFFVSYQVPGTPGRLLLDEGKYFYEGSVRKARARVEKFDFSSHVGMSQLHGTLAKLSGKAKVFVVHGERANCVGLADWASRELGLEAVAPKPNEIYKI